MKARSWARRTVGVALAIGASAAVFGVQGCLDRPVVPILPGGSGVSATKIRVTRIDKVDLLLMVDNSLSMGDKQSELGKRIPQLVKSLTNPDKDASGKYLTQPVADLHVGVISSSLGSYGTSACDPGSTNPHNNDHGHLLPRAGEGGGSGWKVDTDGAEPTPNACPAPVAASALTWVFDPTKKGPAQFIGTAGSTQMQTAASCVVQSAKEDGCGYEAQLEAVYHFLIDPQPYQDAKVKCTFGVSGDACGTNRIEVTGVDNDIIAQRKAFLRTDSLLAVVIISDENDASIKPAQLNWLPWGYGAGQMQRGWKGCEAVPDDFEPESGDEYALLHSKYNCYSCFENTADPAGNCSVPWAKDKTNNDIDGRNTREFHQTQRFGYNFYWSRQRYVDGLSKAVVPGVDSAGHVVGLPNPIYAGGYRTPDLVIVAGILGVPKQLVSDDTGKPKALTEDDWAKMISPDLTKRDPHMIESIAPRTAYGLKHFAGDRSIDPINGGERDVTDGDDLQYACIEKRALDDNSYDCQAEAPNAETKNPLCGPGSKQPYFKAYPSLRELRVIHDLGPSGFVASLCNNTYAPAIKGIIDKLQAALNSQCLKTVLTPDATGNVNCLIEESLADDGGGKACEAIGKGYCTPGAKPCRVDGSDYPPISPDAAASQLNLPITVVDSKTGVATSEKTQAVASGGNVYATGSDGKKHLVCEQQQLVGRGIDPATTAACLKDPTFTLAAGSGGWCYSTDPAVVGDACIKIGAPGTIRFEGDTQPRNGSEVFTLCVNGAAPTTSADAGTSD